MSGPELSHCLRERKPGLPVLIYSGYAEADALGTLLTAPHTLLLHKPAPRRELLGAAASRILGPREDAQGAHGRTHDHP